MRIAKAKSRSRLVAAAMGKIPGDLTIENVQLVNVVTGEIYPASVDVLDGIIVRVREKGEANARKSKTVYEGNGAYLIPGFIDTHMHVESTMMIPEQFARAVLPWGTTTVVTDPHEIGNVMGIEGVKFMLENAKNTPLRQYVLAPSCVPSVPALEGGGAAFHAEEIADLLDTPGVIGIAEVMDYAIAFAETGHLVFATLHANNANQALDRIIHFFEADRHNQLFMDLSLNMKAIVAQQLIPTLDGTGRRAAIEILINSPLISDLIRKGDVHEIKDLMKRSRELGMQTFDQALFDLYKAKQISYKDALKHADSPNDLRLQIKLSEEGGDRLMRASSNITFDGQA